MITETQFNSILFEISAVLEANKIYTDNETCLAGFIIDLLMNSDVDKRKPLHLTTCKKVEDIPDNEYAVVFTKTHPSKCICQKLISDHLQATCGTNVSVLTLEDNPNIIIVYSNSYVRLNPEDYLHVMSILPPLLRDLCDAVSLKKYCNLLKDISIANYHDAFQRIIGQVEKRIALEELVRLATTHKLEQCFSYMNRKRIEKVNNEIMSLKNEICVLDTRRKDLIEKLNDQLFLQSSMANNDDQNDEYRDTLINYLMNNNNIEIRRVSDNYIEMFISSYIVNYDEDWYETNTSKGEDSGFFRQFKSTYRAKVKKLCDDIFIERKYKVRAGYIAQIYLDTVAGMSIEPYSNQLMEKLNNYDARIISPHARYACTGSFEQLWNEAFANQNLVGALNYMIAYAGHINWTDGTVAMNFIGNIVNYRCIEDKDGNIYSGDELIKMEK